MITVIGLSRIGVAAGLITGQDATAKDYTAHSHLALAGGIVLLIALANRFTSGFVAQLGVLLGLVVGTLVAVPKALTDFFSAKGADWFGLAAPFHFGAPHYPIAAVISICVVMLVTFTESTADMLAVGEMTGRPLSKADLARGLAGDSVPGVFAGVMNGFVDTVFAQNVGLVGMTKVHSRTLRKVEFEGTSNLLIVAVSIGIGIGPDARSRPGCRQSAAAPSRARPSPRSCRTCSSTTRPAGRSPDRNRSRTRSRGLSLMPRRPSDPGTTAAAGSASIAMAALSAKAVCSRSCDRMGEPFSSHLAAEEDLHLLDEPVPDSDRLDVAVPAAGHELVLVVGEDEFIVGGGDVQQLLLLELVGGRETPLEEGRLVDVIVLRTREREIVVVEREGRVAVL